MPKKKKKEPKELEIKKLTLDEMWHVYTHKEQMTSLDLFELVFPTLPVPPPEILVEFAMGGMYANGYDSFITFIEALTDAKHT